MGSLCRENNGISLFHGAGLPGNPDLAFPFKDGNRSIERCRVLGKAFVFIELRTG